MKRAIPALLLIFVFAVPCPAQPHSHWYKSKKFWIPFAVNIASMSADYAESQRAFALGARESNPIFGERQPGFGRMFTIGMPIAFAYSFSSYRLATSQREVFRYASIAPTAYATIGHLIEANKAASYSPVIVSFHHKPQF